MNSIYLPRASGRILCSTVAVACLCAALSAPQALGQVDKKAADDDLMAIKIMALPLPIRPPANGLQKTVQENRDDQQRQTAAYAAASARAKEFYTKNPSHVGANEAKQVEAAALLRAVQLGKVEEEPRALRLGNEFRSDKKQPSALRYEVATLMTQMEMGKKHIKDRALRMEEYERQAVNLLGEFPGEAAVYDYFLGIARNADAEKSRSMAQRILSMPAPATIKEQAKAVVDRLDMPGRIHAFEWQDENGVSRRLSDYKGKIVVFYVWATWSAAGEIGDRVVAPAIGPGVELVSVNVDTDLKRGKDSKSKKSLPGSNYFDDRGPQSPLALQLKVDKVPAVHVVDAKGIYVGRGTPEGLTKLLQQAAK